MRLGKHDTRKVAAQFGLGIRLWKGGKIQFAQGIPVSVASKKKGKVGRKPVQINLEALRNIDLKDRMTIEDVAKHLGCCVSTVQKYLKQGLIRRHSNSIKPFLTDANKKARLQFCVDMLDPDSLPDDPRFQDLFDHIYIDEKWFFLTRRSENYYLLPDEDEPNRTCKSKNYIPRIMFLCVSARPRFCNGICTFDGKIGIFPLVTFERAQRSSVNRPAGIMVVKPTSITRDVIRHFMIDKVLPAIRTKWPRGDIGKPIYIQQDNAPSHIEVDDPIFSQAASQGGFDIRLKCQPPNLPDFNIFDLGFFRAIQSIQYKKAAKIIEDRIPHVEEVLQLCLQ
ncbi:hypothetical protein PR202_gb19574 [Eleusine coracana subsp. coracana]|uniref:Transposase n=1 Tax=Eleusine coracana subsp. coracana TaxID=191504 RepID=A0AAV5F980_ELECO|nr:hypothetical protein PR202_gb19574 [Eleusine coracana subsp. coracana]